MQIDISRPKEIETLATVPVEPRPRWQRCRRIAETVAKEQRQSMVELTRLGEKINVIVRPRPAVGIQTRHCRALHDHELDSTFGKETHDLTDNRLRREGAGLLCHGGSEQLLAQRIINRDRLTSHQVDGNRRQAFGDDITDFCS